MSKCKVFLQIVLSISVILSLGAQAANCPSADLTNDCSVDLEDLVVIAEQWLNLGGVANLDGTGRVNMGDFGIFSSQWLTSGTPSTLVINEFMASNTGFIRDPQGDADDWIEIHNYGSADIDVGGMYLTDDLDQPSSRWPIPQGQTLKTTIPAGGYLIIWADGDSPAEDGMLHAPFKLSVDNGTDDIALYDSEGNLIDSIENYPPQTENDSYGRYPNAVGDWRYFYDDAAEMPTPGKSNGGVLPDTHVLINEIMYHPYNPSHSRFEDPGEEYIELFNNSNIPINLSGWRITGGIEFDFPQGSTIGAHGLFVVAADMDTFASVHTAGNNVAAGWVGKLSNKGERIMLMAADGRVIDDVTYSDEGDWAQRNLGGLLSGHRGWEWSDAHDGEGMSLELIAPHMPNEYGQSWAPSLTFGGTPGLPNTATGAETQTVTLVSSGSVWRYSDQGLNLGKAADGVAWFGHPNYNDSAWSQGPAELGYGDGSEATVVNSGNGNGPNGGRYVTTYFRHKFTIADRSQYVGLDLQLLADDGAAVYLNGVEVARTNMPGALGDDTIDYLTGALGALGSPDEYTFFPHFVPAQRLVDGENVLAVEVHQDIDGSGKVTSSDISFDLALEATILPEPTPVPTDIAPLILDVKHNPPIPHSDDEVIVTAKIIDESTSGLTVTLYHRIDHSTYSKSVYPTYNVSSYDSVVMADDGNHGDGAAADGVYGARIPATGQDLAVVEFFVEARDAADNVRTWPAPSIAFGVQEQVTNALYQVEDSFEGSADWTPGDQPIYRIIMTESERARLDYIGGSGDRNSDAQMNATFISVDGTDIKTRYNTGVRNRGHGSRGTRPNNFRVNFVHDNPWKGVTAINLNFQNPFLQVAGSTVFRLAGIASANTAPVRLYVNGSDRAAGYSNMYGSYVHLETINTDFAKDHFPGNSDGNAYKCMRDLGPADLDYRSENPDDYRNSYFKATNERADDWSYLIGMTWVMSDNTPDSIYADEVKRVADTENWLRFLALMALLDNNETSLANGYGDDYYLYRGDVDTRFVLIPHDLDSIFGYSGSSRTASIFRATALGTMERFMNHPEFLPRYYYHLNDLMETVLSADQLEQTLNHALGGYVSQSTINSMRSFVADRNAYVSGLIERDFTITPGLAMSGGYYHATTAAAPISGTADVIETRAVRINGEIADFSPKDGTWSVGQGSAGPAVTLVAKGSVWNYLDDGSDQGTAWRQPEYVMDTAWSSGQAELGYGDSSDGRPEVTIVGFGPNSGDKYVATYYRTTFQVADASKLAEAELHLLRDDAAAVYINGFEVARDNLPGVLGDDTVNYRTSASSTVGGGDETTFFPHPVNVARIQTGTNVIAVEIHQVITGGTTSSSDTSFDLELVAYEAGETNGGAALIPGINRVTIKTYGDPNGTGEVLKQGFVDVWYDTGSTTNISGTVTSDLTLDAARSPWRLTGNLTVGAGVTLTIEPGATIFFNAGTGLTVTGDATALGRLVAEGTETRRIRMAAYPGGGAFNGVSFVNPQSISAQPENRLCYVDMDHGDAGAQAVYVDHTTVLIDNMTWTRTSKNVIEAVHPRLIVRNSVLPDQDNEEGIHGHGLVTGEYIIIEGNTFGRPTGYQDVIDFSDCHRPGPILEVYDNYFRGGEDDGVDLDDCDSHVEGNLFTGFLGGTGTGTPNPLAADQGSEIVAVRNVFVDNINGMLLKGGAFVNAANNTFVGQTGPAVRFFESGSSLGAGGYLDGSIFFNNAVDFADADSVNLTVDNSIMSSMWHYLGLGNIDVDPLFVDYDNDFHLRPGSGGTGTGPNGVDMGAYVPAGASIGGGPRATTHRTQAQFTIGGPGIVAYEYRLMDNGSWAGDWIGEFDIAANPHINLTGLLNGHTYTLHVAGKNSAGRWQDRANAATWSWTVDTNYRHLVISEILARNDTAVQYNGTYPDIVELYYDGPAPMNLADMSITDNPGKPRKYVFAPGAVINPGQFMVLYCEPNSLDNTYLNFSLDGDGDAVYLYESPADGLDLVDSVEFGPQVDNLSIGRVQDTWKLTVPTFGGANVAAPLGNQDALKINEWYAAGDGDDFIELFNPQAGPVDLSNLYLTDNPVNQPDKDRLGPLSFVAGYDFVVFHADGKDGGSHVDFNLSSDQEIIGLFDENLNVIDKVIYYWQTANVSQGRSPDGSKNLEFFNTPTPGRVNRQTIVINEIMAHAHDVADDWIELYNSSNQQIDISGWYLSDNGGNLQKYRIPDGTVVDQDSYVVFVESTSFGAAFALSENGEQLFLTSADNGRLTEYRIKQEFGASERGVSFGRHLTSRGTYDFVSMSEPTQGGLNSSPLVGPIVISEIMYHPEGNSNSDAEYIELLNTGSSTVILYDSEALQTWKFTDGGGVDFSFPMPAVLIDPDERILLVKNQNAFASKFTAAPGTRIFQWDPSLLLGSLSNSDEQIELAKPGDSDTPVFDRNYITVDLVAYSDGSHPLGQDPWPAEADGGGDSLHRVFVFDPVDGDVPAYGNDVENWYAAAPTPGY